MVVQQTTFSRPTPVLKTCPAPLPDQKGRRNTFFESILVAHRYLQEQPTVVDFLDYMIRWAGRSPDKSDFYKQNILHTYYLVGLIPYTSLKKSGYVVTLTSLLPAIPDPPDATALNWLRINCLKSFTNRLKHSNHFWDQIYLTQPFKQDQLRYALAHWNITYKEVTNRVRIVLNLGGLVEDKRSYLLTELGQSFVSSAAIETEMTTSLNETSQKYFLDETQMVDLW